MNVRTQDSFAPSSPASSATCISPNDSTEMKLAKLEIIEEQADYSGMTYDEIYAAIWTRYNDAFDGNMVGITSCMGGPHSWSVINQKFNADIDKNIINPMYQELQQYSGSDNHNLALLKEAYHAVQDAKMKVLGYGDMSFDKIEAEIEEKYAGKNTVLDFLNMQGELSTTGVLKNKMGDMGASCYEHMINYQFEITYNPLNPYKNRAEDGASFMADGQWKSIANQTLYTAKLADSLKEMLTRMTFDGYQQNIKETIFNAIDQFIEGEK